MESLSLRLALLVRAWRASAGLKILRCGHLCSAMMIAKRQPNARKQSDQLLRRRTSAPIKTVTSNQLTSLAQPPPLRRLLPEYSGRAAKGRLGKCANSRSDSCHVQLCYPPRVRLRARARLLNDSVAFRCRPEPLSAQLGRALLRLEIHVHEPEAGTEAVSPFEIVHRAPVEGALYRHTFGKGRVMRVRGAVRD